MGRALGLGWARGGHDVVFGSRDLTKAKATGSFIALLIAGFQAV
jgi:hypothetical protein